MMQRLHFTHLAPDSMIQIVKNSFFWPGLKTDLEATYKVCESCLLNAKEKTCNKQDTIPLDLVGMSPGEEVSLDFADILGKSVLVLKDRASGHVMAEITKDKSTKSVEDV